MTGAAVERVREAGEVGLGDVAQAGDAELLAGGAALGAALVVAAARVLVGGAGSEGERAPVPKVERPAVDLQRAEVDPQRLSVLAAQRRKLVEQAGLGADPVVLHPRAELGELHPVARVLPGEAEQREAEGGLERGAGGEPRAVREVALDRHPAGGQGGPGGLQLGPGAGPEGRPARGP